MEFCNIEEKSPAYSVGVVNFNHAKQRTDTASYAKQNGKSFDVEL